MKVWGEERRSDGVVKRRGIERVKSALRRSEKRWVSFAASPFL